MHFAEHIGMSNALRNVFQKWSKRRNRGLMKTHNRPTIDTHFARL